MSSYFLGFDFSTQQIKAVLTDSNLQTSAVYSVQFDTDVPEFRTNSGVHVHADGVTVTSPTAMWLKALDVLFQRMKDAGCPFDRIAALSGAGQQHGSVFWRSGSSTKLSNMQSDHSLYEQLKDCFAIADSPIWMDSSTQAQCERLEKALGGPLKLAQLTGSRAHHRFTGNQIAKIYETEKSSYDATERISLVSSFACSLFIGAYAPIDFADGSGMNLLDLRLHDWNSTCLDACAPDLRSKLGAPVSIETNCGKISSYFVKRYGFSPDCDVVVFTGDNPASMAAINQQRGDVVASLGTSDTVLVWLDEPNVSIDTHVLCSAMDDTAYMGMLWSFKNGSLTREKARERCGCKDWQEFDALLAQTKPGNGGNFGFYFDFPEILPRLPAGYHRFDASCNAVSEFTPAIEARAVLEGQCLAKRTHAADLGFVAGRRVIVTGGASANASILQMLADVFGSDVFVQDVPHSAALGSAFRASFGRTKANMSFNEFCRNAVHFGLAAKPNLDTTQIYDALARQYSTVEAKLRNVSLNS